jgi:hypothetical protein
MNLLHSLSLDNPFVVNTLYAFASVVLGLLGIVLGQRLSTNGKLCIVVGLAIGLGTMFLIGTSYAYLAPGWCGVFLVGFLLSERLTRLVAGNSATQK